MICRRSSTYKTLAYLCNRRYSNHRKQTKYQFSLLKIPFRPKERRKKASQMAKSYNRYHWNPIRQGYYTQPQVQIHSIKPKVISIPVQFVGTEDRNGELSPAKPTAATLVVPSEQTRASAAATIQRAVRGFLVRKNACVVRQVAAEVDEIERMLKEAEAKIRLDGREQLRVNEALMALLLRLDSVRGVRDFRKKVIRRVIALQETIDSISAAADGTICTIGIGEDREDSSNVATDESSIDNEKEADQTFDSKEETNGAEIELEMGIPAYVEYTPNGRSDLTAASHGTISTSGIANDLKDSMIKLAEESSIDHEDPTFDLEEKTNEAAPKMPMKNREVEESPKRESNLIGVEIGRNGSSSSEVEEILKGESVGEKKEEGIEMKELVENMAAENERLKKMVEQICATSAEQCLLMEGLAGRVENLERFLHRMDRRRKRRGAACSAVSSAK